MPGCTVVRSFLYRGNLFYRYFIGLRGGYITKDFLLIRGYPQPQGSNVFFHNGTVLVGRCLLSSKSEVGTSFCSRVEHLGGDYTNGTSVTLAHRKFRAIFSLLRERSITRGSSECVFTLFSLHGFLEGTCLSPSEPGEQAHVGIKTFVGTLAMDYSFLFNSDSGGTFTISLPASISTRASSILFSTTTTRVVKGSLLCSGQYRALIDNNISKSVLFVSIRDFNSFATCSFYHRAGGSNNLSFYLKITELLGNALLFRYNSKDTSFYHGIALNINTGRVGRRDRTLFPTRAGHLIYSFLNSKLSIPHVFVPPVWGETMGSTLQLSIADVQKLWGMSCCISYTPLPTFKFYVRGRIRYGFALISGSTHVNDCNMSMGGAINKSCPGLTTVKCLFEVCNGMAHLGNSTH